MAFGEPLDWTLQRQQDATQYFSTLEDFSPDENIDIDMSMFERGDVPSTFSQSAMNLAGYAAQSRMPQQQQAQEPGFFSKLFSFLGEVDKPISTRLGFKAEGEGIASSLENIAMEEATRPSNILLSLGGLLTGGLSTGAAGTRVAATAAARMAARNIGMGIGARVAGNVAEQGLGAAGVENPYIRGAVGLGAGALGGSLAGGAMSWARIAKMGIMQGDEAVTAAARAELAAQEAAQTARQQSRYGYLVEGLGTRFGQGTEVGIGMPAENVYAGLPPMGARPTATRAFPQGSAQAAAGGVVPPAAAAAGGAGAGGIGGGGIPTPPVTPPPPPGVGGPAAQAAQKTAGQLWQTASLGEKIGAFLSIPMFLKSNYDLSATGRQLAPVFYAHPSFAKDAMEAQFKALGSNAGYLSHQAKIVNDPRYAIHQLMGIQYGDLNLNREQQLASELTSKLLGWLPGSRAFERAYTAAVNETRFNLGNKLLDEFIQSNSAGGIDDLKQIGSLVNAATGRGSLPALLNQNKFLGQQIFWAPRLLAGRLQVPYQAIFGSGVAQKEAAKQMLAFVGGNTALLTAAKTLGIADVELDPRSSDFGQMVIDGRRYDPWAGYRPIANLTARLAANAVSSTAQGLGYDVDIPAMKGVKTEEGEAGTYSAPTLDIVNRFLLSKMAPIPAEVISQLTGKDYSGERVDSPAFGRAQHAAVALLAPLFLEQLATEAMYKYNEQGLGAALGATAANVPYALGVGGQYYLPRPGELAAMGKYEQLSPEDQLTAIRSQSWQQVKNYANSDAKSYAAWAQAAKKEYMKFYTDNGVDKVLADKYAQSMVDRNPISKIFNNYSTQYENQWIMENPKLAERILTQDLNQPFNKRRLSITKQQAQLLASSVQE